MTRDAGRPLRADAQRNRDKILAAAVRVFTEEGLDAHFERIAKEAGVGTGTFYRNFPTREALIEAAYRNEVARLCDAVPGLLAAMSLPEALRAWTRRFIDYATAKLGMADALRAVVNSGTNPYADSHEMIQAALSSLMDANTAAGTIPRGTLAVGPGWRTPRRTEPRTPPSVPARADRDVGRSSSASSTVVELLPPAYGEPVVPSTRATPGLTNYR